MIQSVVYAATSAHRCRNAPQSVLSECIDLKCGRCKTPCKAVRKTFLQMKASAEKHGRPMVVVCEKCADKEVNDQSVVAMIDEPDIRRDLERSKAERN